MTLAPPSSVSRGLPLGLTGATGATRYVGATASGAPASGTFAVGDFVIDQAGAVQVCTVAGSPGTWVEVGGGGGGPTAIFDSTLVADTASFDVTSIVGTYAHLRLVAQLRGTAAAESCSPMLRLNNDSGANYKWSYVYTGSDSATVATLQSDGTTFIRSGLCPAASANAGSAASVDILIANYAATTFWKQVASRGMSSNISDVAHQWNGGGSWQSTAAVTRITLLPDSGDWLAGSRLTVFGYAV